MEIWKDVLGYKGFYKVSDQGNVKNCYEKPVAVSVNENGVCSVMLTAFKSALEMGNRVIDSAQLASKKTVELANQSLNAAMQHHNNSAKENKSHKKSLEA